MRKMKKMVALATLMAMLGSSASSLNAQQYAYYNGGEGYSESYRSMSLAPAIALGTIAIVAIIAVAVQNSSGHGHSHSH